MYIFINLSCGVIWWWWGGRGVSRLFLVAISNMPLLSFELSRLVSHFELPVWADFGGYPVQLTVSLVLHERHKAALPVTYIQ
jgi:hypothetical protein